MCLAIQVNRNYSTFEGPHIPLHLDTTIMLNFLIISLCIYSFTTYECILEQYIVKFCLLLISTYMIMFLYSSEILFCSSLYLCFKIHSCKCIQLCFIHFFSAVWMLYGLFYRWQLSCFQMFIIMKSAALNILKSLGAYVWEFL